MNDILNHYYSRKDLEDNLRFFNEISFSQKASDMSEVNTSHDFPIDKGSGDRFTITKTSNERFRITNESPDGHALYVDSYCLEKGDSIEPINSVFIYDRFFSESSFEGPSFIYGFNPSEPELWQLSPANRGCSVEARSFTRKFYKGNDKYLGIEDVSFEIRPAEFVGIYGNSGVGKTVLIESMIAPNRTKKKEPKGKPLNAGTLLIDKKTPRELARSVAYLPQHIQFPAQMKCRELLKQGYADRNNASSYNMQNVQELLRLCTLPSDILNERCGKLSGGQQRRLALAMTLLNTNIRLIIADEPTSGLDIANEMEIMRTFRKLSRSKGITIIVVTHAVAALRLFDRVMVLRKDSDKKGASLSFNSLWIEDAFPAILKDSITQDAERIAFLSSRSSAYQLPDCKDTKYQWPFSFGEFFNIRQLTLKEKIRQTILMPIKYLKDSFSPQVFWQYIGWFKNTSRLILRQKKSLAIFIIMAIFCVISIQLGATNDKASGCENLVTLMSLCAPWLCATYATVFTAELLSTFVWESFSGLRSRSFTTGILSGLLIPSIIIALVFNFGLFFRMNNMWLGKQCYQVLCKVKAYRTIAFFFSPKSISDWDDDYENRGDTLEEQFEKQETELKKQLSNKELSPKEYEEELRIRKREYENQKLELMLEYLPWKFSEEKNEYRPMAPHPQYRLGNGQLGCESQGANVFKSADDSRYFADKEKMMQRGDLISPITFFFKQWLILILLSILGSALGVAAIAFFRDVKSSTIALVILFIAFIVFSRAFIDQASYMYSLGTIPKGKLFVDDINWFIPICISFVGIGRYAFNVLSYPTSSSNYYIEWLPLFVWFLVSVIIAHRSFASKSKNWRMMSR